MHYFNYSSKSKTQINYVDEFLHGWCSILQYLLINKIEGSIAFEIFEKTNETNGEFYNDHQIVFYKEYFIDVRGIFTEEEMIEEHRKEHIKMLPKRHLKEDENIEIQIKPASCIGDEEFNSFGGLPVISALEVVEIILALLVLE